MFATQETCPYDIALVSLEEDLHDVPLPVLAEHFQEGKGQGALWSVADLRKQSAGHSNPLGRGPGSLGGLPASPLTE